MDAIRLLHRRHYDYRRRRFTSVAFKNSGENPGISIIDCDCILNNSNSICSHIRKFYQRTAGEPPIYWRFNTELLPNKIELEQENSASGDECHYNIRGLSDREARKFFKSYNQKLNLFKTCKNGNSVELEEEDLIGTGI
jgi:hypothetical protein